MKFLIIAVAFLACVYADVSELGYSYDQPAPAPQPQHQPAPAPKNTYIPPAAPAPVHQEVLSEPIAVAPQPAPVVRAPAPAPVVHHPAPAPVVHHSAPAPVAPVNTYIPPAAPAPQPQAQPIEQIEHHADDGYRYKTVRRRVFRHRA